MTTLLALFLVGLFLVLLLTVVLWFALIRVADLLERVANSLEQANLRYGMKPRWSTPKELW